MITPALLDRYKAVAPPAACVDACFGELTELRRRDVIIVRDIDGVPAAGVRADAVYR